MVPQGASGLRQELDRRDADGPFHFASSGPDRAVVIADGVRIVLVPVTGLCLAEEAFEHTDRGAFAAVADCEAQPVATAGGADAALTLPPSFSGLITISVSGEPMYPAGQGKATALRNLRDFLGSVPGLARLGRNGSGHGVEMREARQIGEGLYVRVRDGRPDRLALLDRDFWRAFIEIEGRLVLVTVSGFADRPMAEEQMLAMLAAQVSLLRRENGAPLFDEEMRLAESVDSSFDLTAPRTTDPSGGLRSLRGAIAGTAPARAPEPPERLATAPPDPSPPDPIPLDPAPAGVTGPATDRAPQRAPLAPSRPRRG